MTDMETANIIDLKSLLEQIPYWVLAFGTSTSLYVAMTKLGNNHLSDEYRDSLRLWLRGDYKDTWSKHFCRMFDALFGDHHLSWTCFRRSALASFISIAFLFLLFGVVFNFFDQDARAAGNLNFFKALFLGAALNIIPDYLSLLETRWLLKRFEHIHSFVGQWLVLLADAFFTGAVIWISINIYQIIVDDKMLSVMKMVAVFSIFSVFFYSTFLTSVWAWIYCIASWIMRLCSDTWLKNFLNIEKKPIEQVSLFCALGLFFF